ncbi:MAG: hypothetical protein V1494_01660 [Candidatus Diapherotrites archaeon]
MNFKGQGTTEYLIILAVVIVIALVVVGVLGFLPGMGTGVTESQSKAYWASQSPLAVTDWQITGTAGDATIVLRNQSSSKITVTGMHFHNGTTQYASTVTSTTYSAGEEKAIPFIGSQPVCTSGQSYSLDFNITYSTPNISGKTEGGTVDLIGSCP